MKKKAVLGLPFSWLFAIIVGAFIIFMAIYGVSKFSQSQKYVIDTATAKKLSIIFDPMETGLASGKSNTAKFSSETRIYNTCSLGNIFGRQKFSIATKHGIGGWSKPGGEISVNNKYVFSDEVEEGKEFFFLSMPFNFPYKISELIFMSSKKYCFINPPEFIKEDIISLNLKNLYVSNETCLGRDIEVCFSGNCDIKVEALCSGYDCDYNKEGFDYGSVRKNKEVVYYSGNLIYGAIFSEFSLYECNVKRLIARGSQIAYLYSDEANFLEIRGCGSDVGISLLGFGNQLDKFESSQELLILHEQARQLDDINSALECKIW